MKRLMVASLGALALSGCMGSHLKKLPVCDGKHHRPANLYGTILPTLPVPVPPSGAGAAAPDGAPPSPTGAEGSGTRPAGQLGLEPSPSKTSLRLAPVYYASC